MKEILVFGLSENRGGIETYLYKIWRHIDHNEFHFNIIDMTGKGKRPCFYQEFLDSGASFYEITPRCDSIIQNYKDIMNMFKNHHFDLLHFNVNTLSYITPVQIAIINNVPVIVHSRNGGTTLRPTTYLLHYFNKIRLAKMNLTRIAVSEIAGRWLFAKSSFEIYNNGIDVNKFTFSKENRTSIRKELDCLNRKVIGNVGAFLPAKNHIFIIEIFEKIAKENEDVVLWLIGEGKGREEIESLVNTKGLKDKVFFLGKRNDVEIVYSGMDCFLFPSIYEGFPNSLLEAECEGLPCIVSDRITNEVIIDSCDVLALSLDSSVDLWAESTYIMLNSEKQIEREKAAARVRNKGFSVEQEIVRIESLYDKCIRSNRRRDS